MTDRNTGIVFKLDKNAKIHYMAAPDKAQAVDTLKHVYLTVLKVNKRVAEPFAKLNGKVVAVATDGSMLGIQPLDVPADLMITGGVTIPANIWKELPGQFVTVKKVKEKNEELVHIGYNGETRIVPNVPWVGFETIINQAGEGLQTGRQIDLDFQLIRRIAQAYPSGGYITFRPTSTKPVSPLIFEFFTGDGGCGLIMPVSRK
jgi:hypothetical protein